MNYSNLKLFVRNLQRNKLFSLITIFGFAAALTFILLMSVYVRQELAVDGFHENKDRIYKLTNGKGYGFSGPIGPKLKNDLPVVEDYLRLMYSDGIIQKNHEEKLEVKYVMADPNFFTIFSFPLLEGNPANVIEDNYSAVISRSFANKVFGGESPIGKRITIDGKNDVIVNGIMEDISDNTHFLPFDIIININAISRFWNWEGNMLDQLGFSIFNTYLVSQKGVNLSEYAETIFEDFKTFYPVYQTEDAPKKLVIEPLTEVYFSSYEDGGRRNSKTFIMILVAIISVILLLAVINYINLSLAKDTFRVKEMSVKKLLGNSKIQFYTQCIIESALLCCLSFVLACIFAYLLRPVFNNIMETNILLKDMFSWQMIIGGIAFSAFIGAFSGIIPALVLDRQNIVEVMKGSIRKKTKGVYSKALISFQYMVAITLTICTIVLVKQTHFMKNYDLGFTKDNIARFSYVMEPSNKETLKSEFGKIPGVKNVAFVKGDPISGGFNQRFKYNDRDINLQSFSVDTSFFSMFELNVVPTGGIEEEGDEYTLWSMRNGKVQEVKLRYQSVWLNQEAVRQLGLETLPKGVRFDNRMQQIRGVVNNFHIKELSQVIQPTIIFPLQAPESPSNILIQFQGDNQLAAFREVERIYKEISGGMPFEAAFIEDEVNAWYSKMDKISGMIGNLSVLALVLSAMGILAMATFFLRQRIKEIGIRRVNGATIQDVLQMLINSFLKWIILAFVIAAPLAYYFMNKWLMQFAYRTSFDWWIFVVAGGLAVMIALFMIVWQSWKTASANPVDSLRTE